MSATILSEDEVDELLYCARTNDMEGLHAALNTVSQRLQIEDREILQAAVEPDSGNSVLHMAAANGHTDILRLFLDKVQGSTPGPVTNGAAGPRAVDVPVFVNRPNNNGSTALHWAALNGHMDAVKLLVLAGGARAIKNNSGREAVDEAERAGKQDVATWLLSVASFEDVARENANGVTSGEAGKADS